MIRAPKNVIVGAIFIALALLFGASSLSLNLGTAARMGPGYFPMMLSIALGVLGMGIAAIGFLRDGDRPGKPNFRGLAFVALGVVFFAFAVRPLGLVPAVFVSSMLFSIGGREFNLKSAASAALVLAAGSWALFIIGLRMPWTAFGRLFW